MNGLALGCHSRLVAIQGNKSAYMGTACSTCSKAEGGQKFHVNQPERATNVDVSLVKFRDVMKSSFKNPKVAFDMLDKDGDCCITKEEWMSKLGDVGRSCKWDEETMEMMGAYGDTFFNQMDTNKNGVLTYKEFKTNLKHQLNEELENFGMFREILKANFKKPKDAFAKFDRNSNNIVSKEEWQSTLSNVGQSLEWDRGTMEIIDRWGESFFNQMDTDGNGELTFGEFKENLRRKLKAKDGSAVGGS